MRWTSALAIYLLIWSLALFAVLPLGVRTPGDTGERPVAGQADSAPLDPQLRRKAWITTWLSALIFALYWANYTYGWLTMNDILTTMRPPNT